MRNTYSVYDTMTGDFLLEEVKKKTVKEVLGICSSSIDYAISTGKAWHNRYEIEENETDFDVLLLEAWDTYMPKLRAAGENKYRAKKIPDTVTKAWDTYTARIREVGEDRLSQIRIGCGEESKATA